MTAKFAPNAALASFSVFSLFHQNLLLALAIVANVSSTFRRRYTFTDSMQQILSRNDQDGQRGTAWLKGSNLRRTHGCRR